MYHVVILCVNENTGYVCGFDENRNADLQDLQFYRRGVFVQDDSCFGWWLLKIANSGDISITYFDTSEQFCS